MTRHLPICLASVASGDVRKRNKSPANKKKQEAKTPRKYVKITRSWEVLVVLALSLAVHPICGYIPACCPSPHQERDLLDTLGKSSKL